MSMTVSELANRLASYAPGSSPKKITRQIRYWTTSGVIPSMDVEDIRKGSGKHRTYTKQDAAFVALAFTLDDMGMTVTAIYETLRRVPIGESMDDQPAGSFLIIHRPPTPIRRKTRIATQIDKEDAGASMVMLDLCSAMRGLQA